MKSFKIAIVGAAGGRGRFWTESIMYWKKGPEYEYKIIAFSDINKDALESNAEAFEKKNKYTPAIYLDYNVMFEKEEINLVIIATPHFLHAEQAIAAANNGINILMEKPMAINLEQTDAMIEAIQRNKVKFAIGFQHRFDPDVIAMKNLVKSGDLGKIFQINAIYHWYRDEAYYLNSSPVKKNEDEDWEGWKGHWKTEGGGAIANQHVHFLENFIHLAPAPIRSVMSMSKVSGHTFAETDDNTNAIVEFEDGTMGFLQSGVAYKHNFHEEIAIFGTEGSVERKNNLKGALGIPKLFIDDRSSEAKKKKRKIHHYLDGTADKLALNLIEAIEQEDDSEDPSKKRSKLLYSADKHMFLNIVEAIVKDDASIISVNEVEGRRSVELIRAILLSQVYGKRIIFPFTDEPDAYPRLEHNYVAEKFKDMV